MYSQTGSEDLVAELTAARQSAQQLRDELQRVYDTRTFRWTAPARDLYRRILDRYPGLNGMDRRAGGLNQVNREVEEVDFDPATADEKQAQVIHRTIATFEAMYIGSDEGDLPAPPMQEALIRQFNRLYYYSSHRTWKDTRHRGIHVQKCPLDLWVYQELIHEVRPDVIIETGTLDGGSAYFLADMCELNGTGRVVSVDIQPSPNLPTHDRITYVTGSSTDPDIVAAIKTALPGGAVLVILDSDHSRDHVLQEMETYGPMVTKGSYMIVEDTNINGHPVLPNFGPGPMEAVAEFLRNHPEFAIDEEREKFMVTQNPSGYLRRLQ
jgi:cephalosporin hydroxylase